MLIDKPLADQISLPLRICSAPGAIVCAVLSRPRWLLAIPDAIRQLEDLDRELLVRRDIEQVFGVSRARAAQLMHASAPI